MKRLLALHRRGIALTLLLLTVTALAGTALLGLAGHFLTAAALAGIGALGFNLFGPSAGIRGLTFIRILSRYGEKLVGHDVTLRIGRDLRLDFFRRALPLAPLGLGRLRTGQLLSQLVADIERVEGGLVRAYGPLLALAGLVLTAGIVAVCALPAAGLTLLTACILLGAVLPWLVTRGAHAQEHRREQARATMRADVLDAIQGATDLAALHADATWFVRIDNASQQLAIRERQRKRYLAMGSLAHGLVTAITLATLLALLLDATRIGTISAPAAVGLFFMSVATLEACAGAALAWRELIAARGAWQRLRTTVGANPLVNDPAIPAAVPVSANLTLERVDFRWADTEPQVLDQADLSVAAGQRIAITGDSGSGKSSLLALLLRLRDPDHGAIRYGEVDLREFTQAQWHQQIAWLPQEAPVFAGTVRENLRLGAPDADDDTLWQALAQVRLETLVHDLPGQLDAWIGEHGRTLSAGQARRIALARALLRNAPLLILDEPTEGLDVDTAQALLNDVANATEGRTVIVITHAALPLHWADATWHLERGRLLPVNRDST